MSGHGGGHAEEATDLGPGGSVRPCSLCLFFDPLLGLGVEAGEQVELGGGVEVFHESPVGQVDEGAVEDQDGVVVDSGARRGRGAQVDVVVHRRHRRCPLSFDGGGGAGFVLVARLAASR